MKLFNMQKLFDNNRFVVVFSLLAAAVCWVVVAMTTTQTIPQTIYGVPVNLDIKSEALRDVGLSYISSSDASVDVYVKGQRTVVGGLAPEDLLITVRVSGITESGSYPLQLISENQTEGFEIVSIEPSVIQVRLDQIDTREFTVTPDSRGVSTPPDYMLDTESIRPGVVSVTGPVSELDRIDKVVATAELREALTKTYSADIDITLLDIAGQKIIPQDAHLSLSQDTVNLVIPVLQNKTLPLEVAFVNQPENFPLDILKDYMIMSSPSLRVAAPSNVLSRHTQLRVGPIDLRALSTENSSFSFDIPLPSEQFVNMENISRVTVDFATDYWKSATFNVTNFELTNLPHDFDVSLLTTALSVTFVGDEDSIEDMTVDDIVAEVRLSDRDLVEGQQRYAIRLSAPTKGLVWPIGEAYTVIIIANPVEDEE